MPPSQVGPRVDPMSPASNRPALASSSAGVRRKFFQRIGILRPLDGGRRAPVSERSARDLRDVPRFTEPLHYPYDHHDEKERREPRRTEQNKRVDFQEDVTVVLIPMRSEYSKRIRPKLWSNNAELCDIAARNAVEFAAEGYDWRGACLEDEMFVCGDTGELIHPVHLELGNYTFGTGGSCQRLDDRWQECRGP